MSFYMVVVISLKLKGYDTLDCFMAAGFTGSIFSLIFLLMGLLVVSQMFFFVALLFVPALIVSVTSS
jgi:hypothetical protein